MKQQINFRASKLTASQLAELVARTGMNQTEIIAVAIDRMHREEEYAMKASYEYYEDNGGGLHMFVLVGDKVVDGITNLEGAQPGEWHEVKNALNKNARTEVKKWDGHMRDDGIDPNDFHNEIARSEYGYDLVCEDGTLYPDRMGRAAQIYFGVERD